MKILFFHYSMQSGGAERTIALLSDYASRHGDVVSIVTMDDQPSFYLLNPSINQMRLNICRNSINLYNGFGTDLASLGNWNFNNNHLLIDTTENIDTQILDYLRTDLDYLTVIQDNN